MPAAGVVALSPAALPQAARMARQLGIDGPSERSAQASTQWSTARQLLLAAGIGDPRLAHVETLPEAVVAAAGIGYPVLLRPAVNLGHHGQVCVLDRSGLQTAWAAASQAAREVPGRPGGIVVEPYHPGSRISLQTMTTDGRSTVVAAVHTTLGTFPPLVPLRHTVDSEPVEPELAALATQAMAAIGAADGSGHVDVVLTPSGPEVVDIAATVPSACLTELVRLATGIDLVLAAVTVAAGHRPLLTPAHTRSACEELVHAETAGRLERRQIDLTAVEADWFVAWAWEQPLGTDVAPPPAHSSLLARCTVTGPTLQACRANARHAREALAVTIAPQAPAGR